MTLGRSRPVRGKSGPETTLDAVFSAPQRCGPTGGDCFVFRSARPRDLDATRARRPLTFAYAERIVSAMRPRVRKLVPADRCRGSASSCPTRRIAC